MAQGTKCRRTESIWHTGQNAGEQIKYGTKAKTHKNNLKIDIQGKNKQANKQQNGRTKSL